MNSLKKGEGVPLLNFEGGPGILLLNFEGGPGVRLLNFEGGPGPTFTPCHATLGWIVLMRTIKKTTAMSTDVAV